MRLLHTSDWHLGGQLMNRDRREEHRRFLDWLLTCAREQRIDALIVAGDIFDSATPPSYALELYYDFLRQLGATGCRQAVIVGGNHDSAAVLNAPRRLLAALDITVIGAIAEDPDEALVVIRDCHDDPAGIVCAVPFLRDRDLKGSVAGESWEERQQAIRRAAANHYGMILARAELRRQSLAAERKKIPIIATGHLFAAGATVSDGERDIHVGSLGGLSVEAVFPPGFAYLALGHIHRPQTVAGRLARYSGSPIPLSFGEAGSEKSVVVVDFPDDEPAPRVQTVAIPCFRKLLTITGDPAAIESRLAALAPDPRELPVWIEIQLDAGDWRVEARERISELTAGKNCDILAIRHLRSRQRGADSEAPPATRPLAELTPAEVFSRRLGEEPDLSEEDRRDLVAAFQESLALALEREKAAP